MASDKSISSSHSIPFSKSRDAFEDMTAFTPPVESWIIKYPKKENQEARKPRSRVPKEEELEDPCRRYIETSDIPVKSNKSLGTDDHFKSAVCSKNLLKACEKIMSSKDFSKHQMEDGDEFDAELSLMNENSRMEYYRQKHSTRRGSQSLPASPKLERKSQVPEQKVVHHNPYFTIPKHEEKRESNLSFLTNLFGITAAKPAEAKANLEQKYEYESKQEANNNSSYYYITTNDSSSDPQQRTRKLTPKPHEYREMNIFSPTSM